MKRILVCTDGSIIAQKAVDICIELQGFYKNEVILYSNMKDTGVGLTETNLRNINPTYLKFFTEKIKDNADAQREWLNGVAKTFPYPNMVKTYVDLGEIGKRIVEVSIKEEVECIFLGNRGLGRAKQAILGSVSKHVSQNAPMSVMIVR